MSSDEGSVEIIARLTPAILRTLHALEFTSRHISPATLRELIAAVGKRDDDLGPAGTRGAFSLYVPEYYDPARAWPLVVALHGGSGNGGAFLCSWVREARSRGFIVIAPTARGSTWSLMEPEVDGPNIDRMVEQVGGDWNLDPARWLLTGMSDGGTFTYVLGLRGDCRFTHLAPIAAVFHPMMM